MRNARRSRSRTSASRRPDASRRCADRCIRGLSSGLWIAATITALLVLASTAGAKITGLPQASVGAFAPPAAPPQQVPPASSFSSLGAVGALSWSGVADTAVAPPDPNGAIGPKSYIEIINSQVAIYARTGALLATADSHTLTGHAQLNLADPMILWDPDTQRFYYNVWDVSDQTMAWGFSKSNNPTAIPASFCHYTTHLGYTPSEFTDYPKLGQSKRFLMIGVNHYASAASAHADRSDLLWIDKPQGSAGISTCPAAATFLNGRFTNLRNQDGTQAWTPVPAIQDDPSSAGWVVTSSDIECPDICGQGTKITLHSLIPSVANPKLPIFTITGRSITVPVFSPPAAAAAQKGSLNELDTLDGRLEHAVSAIDPRIGKSVIWTGHSVNSAGNRTEFRWYEIAPSVSAAPSLISSGIVKSPSLFVFNGAVAPDRTVNPSGAAHGGSIVIGFTTSSASTFAADQMVSKVGAGPLSSFVLAHASTTPDSDFTCTPCRWGDYGGATSDPAQSLVAPHGAVWLSNEAVTAGRNTTWNWEAKP
jgi:hypothetical protein